MKDYGYDIQDFKRGGRRRSRRQVKVFGAIKRAVRRGERRGAALMIAEGAS